VEVTLSDDGSNTAYSKEFGQHYHSTKDGALAETLYKHVQPCIDLKSSQDSIVILDICFGLGFNVLTTLFYLDSLHVKPTLHIISPEFDKALVQSLDTFSYPKEFEPYLHVIASIAKNGFYKDDKTFIEVIFADARKYISTCNKMFDIVYQDAFSPEANHLLWSSEYFSDIAKVIKKEGILSTYSIALKVRLGLYENGFKIYLLKQLHVRDSTLASKSDVVAREPVDMPHKIRCNAEVKSIKDSDIMLES